MKNRFPFIIQGTAVFTAFVTVVLAVGFHVCQQEWMLTAAISFGTTAYHFLMRLLVGLTLSKATNYAFDYKKPWFQPRKWEPSFYKKLNIKRWKGSLPTYAPIQFSLETNSMYRVIQNMCGAELVHEIIMVLSFLPLLAVPVFGAFPVFLITSVLAALFDSLFVMAQRFNRPRLIRIYEKQESKCS